MEQNVKFFCKIYELKGLINSLSCLASIDDTFDHPLLERLEETINETIREMEALQHG